MVRNNSSYRDTVVRAVTAAIMVVSAANATITITPQQAKDFFGGRPAKVAYFNYKAQTQILLLDFSKEPYTPKIIRSDAVKSNMKMSPDGQWLVYGGTAEGNGPIYITKVEENSQVKISLGNGGNPTWWVHPVTRKLYVLIQRGQTVGGANGIYSQELGSDMKPVGEAKLLVNEPMANGGRSPDGQFLGNNDEEHVQCWHGHGFYDISPADATASASIKYWVYVSAVGWYGSGKEWSAYCNGAMSPAPVGHKFHRALCHMGSAHYRIFIRRPANYESLPKVKNQDSGVPCNDLCSWDSSNPMLTVEPPKSLAIGSTDPNWGYSDWSNDPDFIAATGGSSGSSKSNPNGYFVNIAKTKGTAGYAVRWASSEVAEPNLWVGSPTSATHDVNGKRSGSGVIRSGAKVYTIETPASSGQVSVGVFDASGRCVLSKKFRGGEPAVLSLSSLPTGSYFLQVNAGGKMISRSVVHGL